MLVLSMHLITLWEFEIEILSRIEQHLAMVEVYSSTVLILIIVNMMYIVIPLLTTQRPFLEVPSNGMMFSHKI